MLWAHHTKLIIYWRSLGTCNLNLNADVLIDKLVACIIHADSPGNSLDGIHDSSDNIVRTHRFHFESLLPDHFV